LIYNIEPVSTEPAVHNVIFRDKELKGNLKSLKVEEVLQ